MTQSRFTGDARLPLHVLVNDDLSRRISSGEWSPDTPLPPERQLADEYGISIGTMRRVLTELTTEGRLVREQGRGTFVRRLDFTSSFTRFFRLGAHSDAIPESTIVERSVELAQPAVASALALEDDAEVLRLERHRCYDGTPKLLETIYLPLPQFQALTDLPVEEFGLLLYPLYETTCDETVTSAAEVLHIEQASATDAQHLSINETDTIVAIERTARNLHGAPIEYRISRGNARGFTYRLDIK